MQNVGCEIAANPVKTGIKLLLLDKKSEFGHNVASLAFFFWFSETSKIRCRMNHEAWIKIAKGAAIAVGGALLAYGANIVVPFLDANGGIWGPAVASLLAIAIQTARKLLEKHEG